MTLRRTLAALALALVAVLAIVSLLAPELLAAVAPSALVPPPEARSEAAERVLLPVGLLALAVGAYATYRLASGRSAPPMDREQPVESGWSRAVDVVGGRFRQERARAARDWSAAEGTRHADEFRERLRDAAVEARVLGSGVDRDAAREAVRTGRWTDDPLAAWFLAAEDADVPLPPGTWLRLRLLPLRTYHSAVDRTTEAVDRARGEA